MARNFSDDLLTLFFDKYTDRTGHEFKGQAISFAMSGMRELGWKNLGSLSDFERACERRHFTVIEAKNRRGQTCRVVTV